MCVFVAVVCVLCGVSLVWCLFWCVCVFVWCEFCVCSGLCVCVCLVC